MLVTSAHSQCGFQKVRKRQRTHVVICASGQRRAPQSRTGSSRERLPASKPQRFSERDILLNVK
jgi:hypothetical protein